jgi:di/tricarboxylate transporter
MPGEAVFVFALIVAAAALMASNRVRFDVVALLVMLALMLSGVLTVGEALSGFGSPVVVLVAGLLVVGEMLARTGVARAVGDWILKKGGSNESRLLVLIMLGAALLGSVMSSTAVVAIFIPIVLQIAAETNLNASRMLMPMSYAALISGMLTLIATTPNIVMHEELINSGYDGFSFFGFAPIGVAVLAVAIGYVLLVGRRLLRNADDKAVTLRRARSFQELWADYRVDQELARLRVGGTSDLAGHSLTESEIETRYRVRVLGIQRRLKGEVENIHLPEPGTVVLAGDLLLVTGNDEDHERFAAEQGLVRTMETRRERQRWLWEAGGATVLVHPESTLNGKTLREIEFRKQYNLHVIGLRRGKKAVADFAEAKLHSSDSLLVVGPWAHIAQLQSHDHDFVVLEMPSEHAEIVPSYRRMPLALGILTAMVLLTLFDVVPLVTAVLLAALAAVFTRCLTMEDAYRAVHWSSLVLIAGMLPLADALDKTGGTRLVVDALLGTLGDSGPYMMMTVIFFLTAGLSLVLSNTASAVLAAPIAIYTATAIGVSPYPFAVAVVIAASAAYSTPVSTPVVTLVVDPGRYKFSDFIRVGVPLLLLTYLVTLVLAPLVFPFGTG